MNTASITALMAHIIIPERVESEIILPTVKDQLGYAYPFRLSCLKLNKVKRTMPIKIAGEVKHQLMYQKLNVQCFVIFVPNIALISLRKFLNPFIINDQLDLLLFIKKIIFDYHISIRRLCIRLLLQLILHKNPNNNRIFLPFLIRY